MSSIWEGVTVWSQTRAAEGNRAPAISSTVRLVSGVVVSPKGVTLNTDQTKRLTLTISPYDATNKAVTWTSSNSNVATVSSSGLVTAKAGGVAVITAKAQDGSGKFDTCEVSVAKRFVSCKDDYRFLNASSSFGYAAGYKIPLARYTGLFGATKGQQLFNASGAWGGSCFGFSSSDSLFFIGGLTPKTYFSSAKCVFDIPKPGTPSSKTTQMIETYQLSWYNSSYWTYNMHKNDYAGLIEALKSSNRSKNGIIALSVYNVSAGHAVVVYDISETATEYVIPYYNNWNSYSDGRKDYLYIKKNSPSMRFSESSMENKYGTAHGLDSFYFVTSAEVKAAMISSAKVSGGSTLVTVSSKNVVIVDSFNNPVPESYIIPPAPGSVSDKILFSLPNGEYSIKAVGGIKPLAAGGQPFVVGIADDGNYIQLSCDSGDFDVAFRLGAAPNLLLSNVDAVIDGQITSKDTRLNMKSLHVTGVTPGKYELSFFDPSSPPAQDGVFVSAPKPAGVDGARQMSFRIG